MAGFESVTWNDDDEATPEKLNQMAQNEEFLLGKAIPMLFRSNNINKTTGIKMCMGVVPAPIIAFRQTQLTINFDNFFSVGCFPVVLVSGASTDKWRAFYSITGYAQGSLHPTEQGFRVVISEGEGFGAGYLANATNVHWLAIGY